MKHFKIQFTLVLINFSVKFTEVAPGKEQGHMGERRQSLLLLSAVQLEQEACLAGSRAPAAASQSLLLCPKTCQHPKLSSS